MVQERAKAGWRGGNFLGEGKRLRHGLVLAHRGKFSGEVAEMQLDRSSHLKERVSFFVIADTIKSIAELCSLVAVILRL